MKRGRGRPPKTPTFSSKILNSGRRGSHHGGPSSPRVSSQQGVKTRDSNRSVQRKHYFEGIQFSESDSDSDSSYESSVSSVVSSVPSYRSPRLRVIPMRSVTPLKLPPSSDDIILPPEHVLQALSIYEVLRQFGRILRLSPFRYEDFCAAIDSAEQSALLSQIHMALFRALLLEDETNGYTFAASDEKDSLNIFLHEVDCFTWPEHIRSYFFSDKSEFGDIFNLVFGRDHNNPFPFVSIEDRLKVLKRLCDLFLASNTVREVIINEGITESEDHCRSCCKMGDLLCCENCPAVYHLHCLKPPLEMVPDGDWLCPICDEHRLKGVTECHTDYTKDGWLRHTPIGTDREGRKYWFLSRRLFVESDDETVRYYSSKPHFDELIEYLEADGQERRLLSALKTKYNTIVKHMAITMSLVEASRGNMTSGLLPRRKHVEAKKSSEAVVETVKEETSPKVSLTFVPDTAVVKMVTKGNQESPNEVETDRRLIAMKQHEEMKEDEEMEEGGNSTPEKDNFDTNNKTLVKQQDICGNDSAKKEDIDVSCRSDINMDSKSPEQNKTAANSSQKSEQVTSEKKGDNIAHGTTFDKSNLLDKQTNIVDSPINAATASGSAAVSLHSVRKIIDFGSSEMESSQPLGAGASEEISSIKDGQEKNHLLQNNDVEQSNDKEYDADVVKPVKHESELDKPVTEPANQGTQVEVTKDEESKMETKEDVKPVKQETELDEPVTEPANQGTQVEVTKDEESKTETKEGVKQEDPGQEEDNKEIIEEDTKQKENKPIITPEMPEPKGPFFRLGMEGNFTAYVNQYATNPLALNKNQHMEYKERKRSVNNKFSVEHEFKISGEIFGPKDVILNTLRCSIVNLENNIPAAFMHPIWPLQRSTWVRAVHIATTPEEFGAVLMFLESLIRPLCFIPVWSDALGHVELHRAIVETKAERAARKREHREEDEEVEVQPRALVNYSWVPMHQIWKQKGEEYRIFKGGGWTWHSGMSTRKRKHCFTKDRREFECKKRKLSKVVDDFINKREEKKKEAERKAKAKLAVQAYKENMKTIQSVTQGKMVTQAITPPKPSVVTNAGVQMNAVSKSTVTTCVNTVVLQGLPVVTVSGGIKSLLPSGNTVTQSSSVTQVTQSIGVVPITQSQGPQVTTGAVQVTQSTVVPQVTPLSSVVQVTQSTGIPKVADSAGVTQVTQSTGVPQVTPLSSVVQVTQSTSIPKVTHSAGVTQVTQSSVVPQVAPLSGIVQVTQSTSLPKVTHSAGVTQVTQSTVVPQVTPLSGIVQVTQSTSMPKVTHSAGVTQVTQSTGVPQVTPLSGVVQVTQSTGMPKVADSVGVTQVTQSTGVPKVTPLSTVVQVTPTTGVPQVSPLSSVTQVTQSTGVPQATQLTGVMNVTQSTSIPKVTHSTGMVLDQQSTPTTVSQTVNTMTKIHAITKEGVASHTDVKAAIIAEPVLLPSGLTTSAAQSLPIAAGLQPVVPLVVQPNSVTGNVMPNDVMPKIHNVTQPPPNVTQSPPYVTQSTLVASDCIATQPMNSTVTDSVSSNTKPNLLGISVVHQDSVQAKTPKEQCSETKTSQTLSQTTTGEERQHLNSTTSSEQVATDFTLENESKQGEKVCASDSNKVTTQPGTTQGNVLDVVDNLSSDMRTVASNPTSILTDNMDTDGVPCSKELLTDKTKNNIVSSTSEEVISTKSCVSGDKGTSRGTEQDGMCSVTSNCTYDFTEDDDWIIIQSNSKTTNKQINQMDNSKTSSENSKRYDCLPSSNAVDVDLAVSQLNIRKEPNMGTTENVIENSIDIHEKYLTPATLENKIELNIPLKTTVECCPGSEISNDKEMKQDNISCTSHITKATSDLNTSSASENVSSSTVPVNSQALSGSQTLLKSNCAASSSCISSNTSNPDSSKDNTSSTPQSTAPSLACTEIMDVDIHVTSVTEAAAPTTLCEGTSVDTQATSLAVETTASTTALAESMTVDTQVTSVTVAAPSVTLCESSSVDTEATSPAVATPASTLTGSAAVDTQVTSVTVAAPSTTLCESSSVDTQATSFAVAPPASTLAESMAVDTQVTSVTVAAPSATCESTSVDIQATSLAVATPASTLAESKAVDTQVTSVTVAAPSAILCQSSSVTQATSVTVTAKSSTLSTQNTAVTIQPTPLAVATPLSTLSKDIPTIAQDTSVTAVKPSSSSISAVTTQPKPFAVAAESLLASSQNTAVTSKSALLTIGAPVSATFSQNSTSTTQVTPLSVTVPSATLSQTTSSVNQGTLPSIAAVSSSQIRKLLTQATLPVTATSTASSQNVTLLTQASLPTSHNSNVGIQTAVLSAPSSATSVAVVPSKSLTTATAAAFPTISGLPLSASSLISLGVPITSSGVVKVSQAVIQDPKSNVNVTSSSQESLGMVLTKTLINTAMKASQNVGSTAKQVTLTATPKMAQSAQPKVVKTVNTTRPQAIAAKPTQQLRAIAPQPRPQVVQPGQTTVLQNSPQTTQINFPLLSGNTLQGGVVKINTSGVSTPGTPVNNIAALVASLPGNTGTPGQPQLIRFVTPSGASFTVQGTIQPGPQGSAPGSTTINVPKRLLTSSVPAVTKPLVVAPKTVAATTNRTTVTVPRPQQPVVPKVNKAVLPPQKKENYPVLEPLVKDPRKLINRVMSKWRNNRCSVKSVFQLKKHERRILGRRAGMREVPGYAYVTRGSGINWPPSFPRPSFKVAWRYRSSSLRTLAGAGLQARILHACLKWEDINIRPPRSNSSTVCTGTGTTSSEVINHRYVTRDGLKCEYLVRKIVRTMRKPAPETPRPPPPTVSKRGRTLRPKINLQPDDEDEDEIIHTGPRVFESWCPESELELWEVRQYNERKERERALEREKKIQEEANRRAAELRAAAIQRRQQEQQAKQQQQILKKKVQNAIKTQQKKLTNVNQATPRVTYKPITMATMSASGITSTQVIRPATVPRQPVPRITNLVTQYRPPSLKQARVPIGTPATGMIRTVTRAQVNYRPLATTTQAKMSTPGVTPTVKAVSNIPYVARGLGMNAPKMKHSSKELQQAKQQIAKAKGKKSGGAGLGPSASKKHVPLETRQEMNRIAVCRKLIDQLIGKIERSEEQERNKESKRKAVAQKQQRAKANKLDGILYKRKEMLKKEIIRKRAVLEKELTLELSKESKKETPTKKRKRESSLGSVGDMLHDKKQKTVEELYCVCRKPYDPTMFYVGCDLCANWFHGECVGVTPERAAIMEQFTCTECSKAQQGVETEELYCLCRQPYDESKFYIGCDTCHDWFHGSCVGMTEVEADMLDSYLCPRCKESQSSRDVQPLSSKDYDSLKRLLRSLQSHKMAWPFLEPVSADDVPGYYDIIKEPMDLSKVEDRLSTKHYNTVEQFNADITTMFDNCRFFNPKESPYYRCAEVLEGFFVKKLRAWQKKA